jgi:hypothetical protein
VSLPSGATSSAARRSSQFSVRVEVEGALDRLPQDKQHEADEQCEQSDDDEVFAGDLTAGWGDGERDDGNSGRAEQAAQRGSCPPAGSGQLEVGEHDRACSDQRSGHLIGGRVAMYRCDRVRGETVPEAPARARGGVVGHGRGHA